MINSSDEYMKLRSSYNHADCERSVCDTAEISTWIEIINNYRDSKGWVVQNKTIPIEILRILAADSDAQVRAVVASKRKCDDELLRQLSSDPEPEVRLRVAYNKSCNAVTLNILRNDSWSRVAEVAAERLAKLLT